MSFNRAESFFSVPDTPPTTKTDKAQWEITSSISIPPTTKMTPKEAEMYNKLMADTSSSGSEIDWTPEERKFYKEVTGKDYESDSSVEMLNKEEVAKFQEKMVQNNERALKRCKVTRDFMKENNRAKVSLFIPHMNDHRLIFVRDNFVGVQNFDSLKAVDRTGVIYKRVILKDGNFVSNFVVSSEQMLYKIDGADVVHKTPGARGIVNISRTNRVPFQKLYAQTFENELV